MTPKEKAEELVDRYSAWCRDWDVEKYAMYNAKQCALIAVDEMINYLISNEITGTLMSYWQEVKQEIEKL